MPVSRGVVSVGPTVERRSDERTWVRLGPGDNKARVTQREDGGLDVAVDGGVLSLTRGQSEFVVIDGGDGNDEIELGNGLVSSVEVHGGEGNDTLKGGDGHDWLFGEGGDDVLEGNDGADYLDGGAGNDVLRGGRGQDSLYGHDGDDRLEGDDGQDNLIGGAGSDWLAGGEDGDALFGGSGDDHLEGGAGDDMLAGGSGLDEYDGGEGVNRAFTGLDESVGRALVVDGDQEFTSRFSSDLEALRSTPVGRALLRQLDETGRPVKIVERDARVWSEIQPVRVASSDQLDGLGLPLVPVDPTLAYNPRTARMAPPNEAGEIDPPILSLFHELTHCQHLATGSSARGRTFAVNSRGAAGMQLNEERETVGLPFDHDGDPDTELQAAREPNENLYREELGLAKRTRY